MWVTKISIFIITVYQRTLSPDHGFPKGRFPYGYCKYYPSCSQYTKEALEKFGLVKGISLGLKRVLRCNPWSQGGLDPILPKY